MSGQMIRTAVVVFSCALTSKEIPLLRGAMLHLAQHDEVLFHDHVGEGFRYRYPLVQYRAVDGCAALVCVGEGVDAVDALLGTDFSAEVRIGRRRELLRVAYVHRQETEFRVDGTEHTYRLRRYLPLNQDNYMRYRQMDSLVERCSLIEHCLVGNILSFAKSMGVYLEQRVTARIVSIDSERQYDYKHVGMLGFDLTFKSNALLPSMIGLGKGVSLGYGEIINETNKMVR